MKTAQFTNWTAESFTGYWDGKGRTFKPGDSKLLPEYLAWHFAKHLTNRELLRTDANGNLVHKNGDKMTSPKFPEQNPIFMELFNKAYKLDEDDSASETQRQTKLDTEIEVLNRDKSGKKNLGASSELQTKVDDGDEDEFEGKPTE